MKVFISWSGELSRELAEALRDWLPAVLQSVKPFFTPNDIEKGARWSKDISQELQASSFGIFCLTKENLTKPWIMFEAGALSKQIDSSRVCPVLFGVDSTDLEGPLVQFQASPFNENEIRKLMKTLNSGLAEHKLDDAVLTSVFEMWWPKLNEKITKILERYAGKASPTSSTRTDRELLEEVLQLARLNTTSNPKALRSSERLDASAFVHSFKHIVELLERIKVDGIENLVTTVKEIFEPLEYVIDKSEFSLRHKYELKELKSRIRDLINEEI